MPPCGRSVSKLWIPTDAPLLVTRTVTHTGKARFRGLARKIKADWKSRQDLLIAANRLHMRLNDYGNQCLYAAPIWFSVVHLKAHTAGS